MPEEVTYATVKFPKSYSTKLQEDVKENDPHDVQDIELDGDTENRREMRVENTVEMSENRAVKGHCGLCKAWCPVLILLLLHLLVLAGEAILFLKICYGPMSNQATHELDLKQLHDNMTSCYISCENLSQKFMNFTELLNNTSNNCWECATKCNQTVNSKQNDATTSNSTSCMCSPPTNNTNTGQGNEKKLRGDKNQEHCKNPGQEK